MRRTLGFVSVAIGVFLVVAAPLVKWYLAPRAVRAPLEQHSVTVAVSDGKSVVLDKGSLTIRTGLAVKQRQVVQGDGPAGTGKVAVWEMLSKLTDPDGALLSASKERVAFDRVTGMAVNCCDEQVDGVAAKHVGLTYKFPFDTRKQDYLFFDSDTLKAWPMVFQGTQNGFGLTLYHFTQKVPATDVETLGVPLSLLGKSGDGAMTVHRYYENVVDVLVEPVSGVIIRGAQHQVQTLRDESGQSLATVVDINAAWTDETQQDSADTAKDAITQIRMVRYILPIAAVVLGLGLAVVGLVLLGLVGRRQPPATGTATAQQAASEPAST